MRRGRASTKLWNQVLLTSLETVTLGSLNITLGGAIGPTLVHETSGGASTIFARVGDSTLESMIAEFIHRSWDRIIARLSSRLIDRFIDV